MESKPKDTRAIESRILVLRGQRVMLDGELAQLYGVKVKALNQAVRRNADRFPDDFMFQLESDEADSLRSQFVTLDAAAFHQATRPTVAEKITTTLRGR